MLIKSLPAVQYWFWNRLCYAWLTLRCWLRNPEIQGGSAYLNGVLITSPRLSTLRFLYKEIVLHGCYHPHQLSQKPLIIDCGASIGVATVYLATMYSGAHVFAFEPNPESFRYLEQNVSRLRESSVDLFQAALGATTSRADLFMSDSIGSLRASLRSDRTAWTRRISVPVQRLSELLHQLARIDLVKMDIEGAEFAVLSELNEAGVLGKPLYYIVEYHNIVDTGPSALGSFVTLLENVGYRVILTGGAIDPTGYQDVLIHACRRL